MCKGLQGVLIDGFSFVQGFEGGLSDGSYKSFKTLEFQILGSDALVGGFRDKSIRFLRI